MVVQKYRANGVKLVCCSKETLLLEPEKTAPRIETLEPEKVDEEEEGKKDESSCSSEEEEDEDSESENEAGALCVLFLTCCVVSVNLKHFLTVKLLA